jgi:hypothetical protein
VNGFWWRATGAAAVAVLVTTFVATFSIGLTATGANAQTVPCVNFQGQIIPCPTTTIPPPTTSPPPTQPPTTRPPVTRPPVTSPPGTSYVPPVTNAPAPTATTAAPTTAPPTTAPPTTGPPPTGPPAILGNFHGGAAVTTTTAVPPSPPSTAAEQAVGLPGAPHGRHLSARFIYAMVLDALLLAGIGGYVVVRRLHLIA